jgi:hypothetical protein
MSSVPDMAFAVLAGLNHEDRLAGLRGSIVI